jgi:hypothetical protein
MRKQLLALGMLMLVLVAATPAPDPVITLDGVSKAARLTPELRTALAPQVKALNAKLEKMVALRAEARKANQAHSPEHDEVMKAIHEIMKQLDEEQRAALHEYLHAQMKAAGIEIPQHPRHHGTHGTPAAA